MSRCAGYDAVVRIYDAKWSCVLWVEGGYVVTGVCVRFFGQASHRAVVVVVRVAVGGVVVCLVECVLVVRLCKCSGDVQEYL